MKMILTADWHLRDSQPQARTDNFLEVQKNKVEFILQASKEYRAPIFIAGDVFHRSKPSLLLLSSFISSLSKYPDQKIYSIAGNHDLPEHDLLQMPSSGFGVMEVSRWLRHIDVTSFRDAVIHGVDWKSKKKHVFDTAFDTANQKYKILILHEMVFLKQTPAHWGLGAFDLYTAGKILNMYPEYDLILTGHNHETFVHEVEGRFLVNPGSITRQTADQEGHEPCFFLLDTRTKTFDKMKIPHTLGVLSREHIDRITKHDERITSFVNSLSENLHIGLDFRKNMELALEVNEVDSLTRSIILKSLEND